MRKRFFKICVPIGAFSLFVSLIFKNMTDFTKGYFEGMAISFITVGLIYYGYCLIKRQSSYTR
ncbi:hypothetical protein [Clostridium manihotivorum]|uniref:Uncharacterized protein n=1 Tax=Clostridium manihotivorum TaxID=2320868 RepID=A0A410DTD7_9CLOT|nr:hypothetical protein [Clostridium manihotivorum]QAA32335.1 hypothetical protein C1I91_12185 [Clostridium manihotivorum]